MKARAVSVLLALALVATAACRGEKKASRDSSASAPARTPRDIVLVTIDTLRYDAVGFDGNPRGTTPNLDRLASESRVFTRAHAHNVITLPSHVNILTGRYPYDHGVRENAGFRLSPKIDTLASILKERGYATGAFVGAFVLDSRYGLTRGFDAYEELYRQTDEPQDFQIQQAPADEVVAEALKWWRSQEGKRRFLWIHVYDPHAPYDPPRAYKEQYPDDFYLGEVAFTDASLVPLLEAVKAAAPAPLLVVTADHGEARGDHGELTHGLFAYEATLHVPLLVWCPGLVPSGRDEIPARHVDIAPTVLDALEDVSDRKLPGQSLLAARREEARGGTYFEALSAALNRGWAPLRGLMAGGEKFIDLPIPELYDLASDPAEAKNLVSEHGDSVRRLRKRLLELPIGTMERGTVGAEEAAKLRSLGYLAGSSEVKASYGPADDPKSLIAVDKQLHDVVDLFQRGRLDEAIALARKVAAENPRNKMAHMQLAFVLQEKGRLQEAIRVYEEAKAQGLGGEGMDRRRAMLFAELGRPDQALALLEPYGDSDDPETLNALGIALTDTGRPAEGLVVFARLLEIDPRSSQGHQDSGVALLRLGRLEEARAKLEKALAISPRSPRAWNTLGVVWSRLGQPQKALEAWVRCVEVNPRQYDALYNMGRVAGQVGNWKLARQALEQFAATAPPARYRKDLAEVRAALADMARRGL